MLLSSGTTQSYLSPKDQVLRYVTSSAGASVLVSTNPSAVESEFRTPSANVTRADCIAYLTNSGSNPGILPDLNFPVLAGEKVYVSVSAGSTVQLFFDDSPETLAT